VNARVEHMFVASLGQRVRFLRQLRGLTTRQLRQEEAARTLREAWEIHGPLRVPPEWSPLTADRDEGLPS
jgi:hypothetical protein